MTPENSDDDGFSILEMIVAMTILALVLGIASQTIVLASRSIVIAREQMEAARKVRAIMAQYDAGAESGGTAGLDAIAQSGWTVKIQPMGDGKAKLDAIVIEKSGAAGTFLTFMPVRQRQ
ncbi:MULTISPECIES: prepilin-type N-terminal cleavage/methylation domain-containing protein [unclassified Mesorhizobium]|uniref:PulJ/GspJ family protein n=1 Tax=unclassified Mesorhizobium TaxID=325217 RepID=UPI001091ED75|nr:MULTISPECIES: prepilin-type N-terminal cleavage/methylation domain-containing protein [unclassified Mesorhizobium]TGP85421.1 prepilin-type N-terminal cleavage/methylation domain-containing protein [Mesorhizobium sp. M8A.F.Ca.ET.218.01.1.1]TGT14469.1 prepilin-type N-terminal cleavage/methylation domain-containing protein [Mesorhizobium sp. M8A.F.Ca.ET.213.01.1.1]